MLRGNINIRATLIRGEALRASCRDLFSFFDIERNENNYLPPFTQTDQNLPSEMTTLEDDKNISERKKINKVEAVPKFGKRQGNKVASLLSIVHFSLSVKWTITSSIPWSEKVPLAG